MLRKPVNKIRVAQASSFSQGSFVKNIKVQSNHLKTQFIKKNYKKILPSPVFVENKYAKISSNINEVIRSVLNFLFIFFTKRFHKHKKAQTRLQRTKIKKYV